MAMEELRTGDYARFDSFTGLVPCKVLSIVGRSGLASTAQDVEILITRTKCGYQRGEVLCITGLHVVPVKAVRKRKFATRIIQYNVHCDREAK